MRLSILYFSTVLALVLSAPIDDISTTENNGFSLCDSTQKPGCASTTNELQIGSTPSAPAGSKSDEVQLAYGVTTGPGRSDISTENTEAPNLIVAPNSDTIQSPESSDLVAQTSPGSSEETTEGNVVPDLAQHMVWNCDDLSNADTGTCSACMHNRCQDAFQVTCVSGKQECDACQLTNGMCGTTFRITRQEIGHHPSSTNEYGQDWCKNENCVPVKKAAEEIPGVIENQNPGGGSKPKSGSNPSQQDCLWAVSNICIFTWR